MSLLFDDPTFADVPIGSVWEAIGEKGKDEPRRVVVRAHLGPDRVVLENMATGRTTTTTLARMRARANSGYRRVSKEKP